MIALKLLRPARSQVRGFSSIHQYDVLSSGEGFSMRKSISKDGKRISPWHDIPIQMDPSAGPDKYTAFFEVPRYFS